MRRKAFAASARHHAPVSHAPRTVRRADAPRGISVTAAKSEDINAFAGQLRGYRLDLMQIDPGRFDADLFQCSLDGALITRMRFARALIQSGEAPPGMITFEINTSDAPALRSGCAATSCDLLVGGPALTIDTVSRPGYGIAAASFPRQWVETRADLLGLVPIVAPPQGAHIRLTAQEANRLRAALDALVHQVLAHPFGDGAGAAFIQLDAVLDLLLLSAFRARHEAKSVAPGERGRIVRAALSAIANLRDDMLSVSKLCRIARTSERTLHYAFQERFGLPPAHYIKAHRLHGVRRDLTGERKPDLKIADVANKWGFWHLGQFAKDYRLWFGELPSDTYRRRS